MLEGSQFSILLRSELWGWPLALTIHVLGTAVVVGLVLIIGLRLLGLFELIPFSSLNRLFPVFWVAVIVQFVSGFFLWMTKATRYVADIAFELKTVLVVIGIVVTYSFYNTIKQEAAIWDSKGAISSRTVTSVALIIVVWCAVLIAGRLTGYLGALYNG